jgi:hypothetical protein
VGYTWVSAGAATLLHAALWDADGTIRDLADGDAGSSDVWAVNDAGTVVGTFRGSTWTFPVVWSADAWAYLPSMGDGAAYGVNSLDEIVGATHRSTSDPARPALWQDRALVDPALFEAPGAYSIAYDLNDLGWMAGSNGASKEFPAQEAVIWKIVESAGKAQGRIDEVKAKLDALIEERKLTRGQGNALKAKLDAAIEMIAEKEAAPLAFAAIVAYAAPLKGNPAAVNVLEAFINQVEAFVRARILTEEDGQALIRSVRVIIARMGG